MNILFARPDHFGDLVLSLPTFAAIKQLFPHARLIVWTQTAFAGLLQGNPHVDAVLTHDHFMFKRPRVRHTLLSDLNFIRKLRQHKIDITILPRYDKELSALLAYGGAPQRIGYAVAQTNFFVSKKALTQVLPKVPQDMHQVRRNLYLLTALKSDFDYMGFPCDFDLPLASDTERSLIDQLGLKNAPYVVLQCGAGTSAKRWPIGHMRAWIEQFVRRHPDHKIVFTGGAVDAALVHELKKTALTQCVTLLDCKRWPLIIDVLRHARLVVSGDTGIMHLASVLETPTIDIHAGTNDPVVWGPFGKRSKLLCHRTDCFECHLEICNRQHECLTNITPAQVIELGEQLMAV